MKAFLHWIVGRGMKSPPPFALTPVMFNDILALCPFPDTYAGKTESGGLVRAALEQVGETYGISRGLASLPGKAYVGTHADLGLVHWKGYFWLAREGRWTSDQDAVRGELGWRLREAYPASQGAVPDPWQGLAFHVDWDGIRSREKVRGILLRLSPGLGEWLDAFAQQVEARRLLHDLPAAPVANLSRRKL